MIFDITLSANKVTYWSMFLQASRRQAQAGLGSRGSTFNVELTGTYKERARKTFQQYFQEINWVDQRHHILLRCHVIYADVQHCMNLSV